MGGGRPGGVGGNKETWVGARKGNEGRPRWRGAPATRPLTSCHKKDEKKKRSGAEWAKKLQRGPSPAKIKSREIKKTGVPPNAPQLRVQESLSHKKGRNVSAMQAAPQKNRTEPARNSKKGASTLPLPFPGKEKKGGKKGKSKVEQVGKMAWKGDHESSMVQLVIPKDRKTGMGPKNKKKGNRGKKMRKEKNNEKRGRIKTGKRSRDTMVYQKK